MKQVNRSMYNSTPHLGITGKIFATIQWWGVSGGRKKLFSEGC